MSYTYYKRVMPFFIKKGIDILGVVRLAAHVSNGLKSRIRPVVGRI